MIGLFARTALVLLVGIAAGYAQNAMREDGVSLAGFEPQTACSAEVGGAEPTILHLAPAEAVRSLDGALVLDTRDAASYAAGHLDGARHLPCASSSADADAIATLASGHPLVLVYGDDRDAAEMLVNELASRSSANARFAIVDGDFAALEAAGAPAESGACDHCTEPVR